MIIIVLILFHAHSFEFFRIYIKLMKTQKENSLYILLEFFCNDVLTVLFPCSINASYLILLATATESKEQRLCFVF